jgi:copper chaperone CopZ
MARVLLAILIGLVCVAESQAQNPESMLALTVAGMKSDDGAAIEGALRRVEGVQQVHVDPRSGRVWVWGPKDPKAVIDGVAPGRLKAALDTSRARPLPPGDVNVRTGPAVGAAIPAFTAVDQHGKTRRFEDLRGPKGLVLLFYRSADW